MQVMSWNKRSFLRTALYTVLIAAWGCGSHEVTYPTVREESLSDEQKAQLDRVRGAQAEAFRKAGVSPDLAATPAEMAQQRLDAEKTRPSAP